ncbi:D-ribose transporter ATP-binding protein [Paenibacillus sp. 32O-W]|uniref:sugar ABC transporter ATP-binding protein n=1 Tax=Paenibacillus sp. 32O-W TaxID=1695218 RepID=UPI000721F738|nr:sugar ABC transporter ATP-binding protein [Paenibacillus sp. 32O-W]ALS25598.1 D-ribose transporter ATP-binding protein [Paenibacillus sp. 32O-W]
MGPYIVEMKHISKSFPGVIALDDVTFNLKAGEVLALLGENGAGKSTLMKILSGVHAKDDGEMIIFGNVIENLTPKKAQELGIAIIHQELNLCGHLSIAENIFLGREKLRFGLLSDKQMRKETEKILKRLNIHLDPETPVRDLPVSKQQMVEIAKAVSSNAKILIMDEPTSALTASEITDLFKVIRKLKADGCGIVYISHRLEELQHIVDRVTIMRDGKYIASMNFADTTMPQIIAHMVGREIQERYPRVSCKRGKMILQVKNLSAGKMVRDVSFELYEGEIVGIAGLMGAGRTETTRAIFSADPKDSGEIYLDGKPVTINKPMDAIRAGIVLAPEDRKKDGLCIKLSVQENIALPNLDWICNRFGIVNKKKEKSISEKSVNELRIKLANLQVNAGTLSGGNQQKVVVAKWIARNSRVVIFDEPTRGIDIAAKVEIYNLMNELKKQGIGVLFVSSEMPEVMGISDRILVMCEGRITGEFAAEEATQDLILEYATKFESKIRQEASVS